MANRVEYEVVKHLGVIRQSGNFTTEVNLISYSGADPKFDIRKWKDENGTKIMLKGVVLDEQEAVNLLEVLKNHFA